MQKRSINRREAMIALGAAGLCGGSFYKAMAAEPHRPIYGGWVPSPAGRRNFVKNTAKPYFRQYHRPIYGTSAGKAVRLLRIYEHVRGIPFKPYFQDIGDCVGQSGTLGCQLLTTTQIAVQNKPELWKGDYSVEVNYAGSREVGTDNAVFRNRSDGSNGSWMAEWLMNYGVLLRGEYGDYDLSKYRPDLGRRWGTMRGVPDELKDAAKEHPVKTVTLVRTWDEVCDSIANGYPVQLCSSIGYYRDVNRDGQKILDRDGFLNRNSRDSWNHAVLLVGFDRRPGKREGGLIANSWGENWLTGPEHELGTPPGCFWADKFNIELHLAQGDCYAFSNFVGYPRQKLDYLLI